MEIRALPDAGERRNGGALRLVPIGVAPVAGTAQVIDRPRVAAPRCR
ncbi:hypothetical protein ACFSTD_07620 [Novosphingobium colocasiae]